MIGKSGNTFKPAGNNNTQQNGNHNSVEFNIEQYIAPKNELTETEIYSLLEILYSSDITDNIELSLKEPLELNKKLHYNKAPKYKKIFEVYTLQYGKLDKIIKTFRNSQKIIQKLKVLFLKVATYDKDDNLVVSDGDKQLNMINSQIRELLISDPRFSTGGYTEEDLEAFIIALLTYSTAACNVLINPN
ncbi:MULTISPECIES: hypothetical protein [Leuconostoc gelidum group]|uniref:hypothetical protein n=1 Tax=Leuconostoc gelidum group TaxID=3016637 RepID=UPI00027E6C56|nr:MULTISPECIES: hypothetical protein [Leuconostoc gelidum group]AFS40249.1 hypothetical protein C269_04030 [Leuconostoc gelidum JB7]MBZ5948028.1 hypothetical protein [Leuconostoc gasicomitatum]MBZ5988181.1 hypothetical protein [Leuconostoc gasicomitatum]MBZ5990152.1 hypothetical protein [Leuconostoc gasicomitatum]